MIRIVVKGDDDVLNDIDNDVEGGQLQPAYWNVMMEKVICCGIVKEDSVPSALYLW